MAIEVLGIHHHATRIDASPERLAAVQNFYEDVLGLGADPGRPTIPGVPGFWINVGQGGQIHLIQATKAELERLGVKYWSMTGINGPAAEQVFVNDPSGNMVELHQVDQCRCAAEGRGA